MNFSMPELSRQKIILLVFGAILFAGVGMISKIFNSLPTGPVLNIIQVTNLAPRGTLPMLATAVQKDYQLRDMIDKLNVTAAPDVFIRHKDVDALIADILFRWAEADMAPKGSYGPYIDTRVAVFLNRIGSFSAPSGTQVDVRQAASLDQLWFKVFARYRIRLLAQTAAGPVYTQKASYDPNSDVLTVNGTLSEKFIGEFQLALQIDKNSAETMRSFLDYIDTTRGFDKLSEKEQDMVMSLTPPKATTLQPLPQADKR